MGRNRSPRRKKPRWLCPFSLRLLAVGHMGILFCLCLFWILLDSPLRGEALLYAHAYGRAVGVFGVILWGVALGLDWMERFYRSK